LLQALTGDKDSDVRWAATEALGKIGGPESIEPLIAALEDKGEYLIYKVKDAAAEALLRVSRRLSLRLPLSRRRAKPK